MSFVVSVAWVCNKQRNKTVTTTRNSFFIGKNPMYRKPSIKPPGGGLIFFKQFWGGGGLKERGGLFNVAKRITCSKNSGWHFQLAFTACLPAALKIKNYLAIELSFLLLKFLSREGCSLEFSSTGERFLEDGLVVPGRYTALSNDKKMVTILHRELERKVEKVKHMKLVVMRPKTKNNMNFQPE